MVAAHHFGQRRDDFAQCSERLVDVGAFFQAQPLRSAAVRAFAAGEVDQRDLACLRSTAE